jgi:hypothetical protein
LTFQYQDVWFQIDINQEIKYMELELIVTLKDDEWDEEDEDLDEEEWDEEDEDLDEEWDEDGEEE